MNHGWFIIRLFLIKHYIFKTFFSNIDAYLPQCWVLSVLTPHWIKLEFVMWSIICYFESVCSLFPSLDTRFIHNTGVVLQKKRSTLIEIHLKRKSNIFINNFPLKVEHATKAIRYLNAEGTLISQSVIEKYKLIKLESVH